MPSKLSKLNRSNNHPIFIAYSSPACAMIIICYSMMVISVLITNLWLPIRIFLVCCLWLDCYRVLAIHIFSTSKYAVVCMQYDCGRWFYQLRNNRCYKAQLQRQGSFCCALFIVLRFQSVSTQRGVLIPRGSISEYNYRWLAYRINCL